MDEWREAYETCKDLLSRPNPPRGITGGYKSIQDCARGLVSEECGGNPVSREQERMNIENLRRKAESGNVAAQSILGLCYLEGVDVQVNYEEAARLLSAAAKHGAPRAMAGLARMYAAGLGLTKDLSEAIRLYEAAAKAGEFLAQIELARLYSRAVDVPAEPDAALSWYSAAAEREANIADCDELREAKEYVKNHGR